MAVCLPLVDTEAAWLKKRREVASQVYVGLDHHSIQFTVAMATGRDYYDSKAPVIKVYAQDGTGYRAVLKDLDALGVPRANVQFLMEASFAHPFCQAMLKEGFTHFQLGWVRSNKLARFRRGQDAVQAGKNDVEDAKLLSRIRFEEAEQPGTHHFTPYADTSAWVKALRAKVNDYGYLKREISRIKTQIYYVVMDLFPELRQVWHHSVEVPVPGQGKYQKEERLAVFSSKAALRLLYLYPSPKAILEAGFDTIRESLGRGSCSKANLKKILELAEGSGGIEDDYLSSRLQLLIQTYWQNEAIAEQYEASFTEMIKQDPVTASLLDIRFLSAPQLAVILAKIGDVHRFSTAKELKRYLNIAPKPLPQSGRLDDDGNPLQVWRLGVNRYEYKGGKQLLKYRSPGDKDVRQVIYFWMEILMMNSNKPVYADDPFIQAYKKLKEKEEGRKGWVGRVRWKVGAKLVKIIYHCLSTGECYDPQQMGKTQKEKAAAREAAETGICSNPETLAVAETRREPQRILEKFEEKLLKRRLVGVECSCEESVQTRRLDKTMTDQALVRHDGQL